MKALKLHYLSSVMIKLASEIHINIDNLKFAKQAESVSNSSSLAAFIKLKKRVKIWIQK